jgi:rhodanese-related sulfurtransferase
MSTETIDEVALPAALEEARAQGAQQPPPYAGGVPPAVAWELVQRRQAVLVDVRSGDERGFVGQVPDSLHVPWATGTALTRNPRFVRELEAKLAPHGGNEAAVLLLCRSGKRSALAAEAKAGFPNACNVLEGFEGDLDADGQRGDANGWRFHRLPWSQE